MFTENFPTLLGAHETPGYLKLGWNEEIQQFVQQSAGSVIGPHLSVGVKCEQTHD